MMTQPDQENPKSTPTDGTGQKPKFVRSEAEEAWLKQYMTSNADAANWTEQQQNVAIIQASILGEI